jgi:hypothetical protein
MALAANFSLRSSATTDSSPSQSAKLLSGYETGGSVPGLSCPMAFTIPSNAVIARLWDERNFTRLQQIENDSIRFAAEDYRTVSTERGPVRGYEGGRGRGSGL